MKRVVYFIAGFLFFLSSGAVGAFSYSERIETVGEKMVQILKNRSQVTIDSLFMNIYLLINKYEEKIFMQDGDSRELSKADRTISTMTQLMMYLHEHGITETGLDWYENRTYGFRVLIPVSAYTPISVVEKGDMVHIGDPNKGLDGQWLIAVREVIDEAEIQTVVNEVYGYIGDGCKYDGSHPARNERYDRVQITYEYNPEASDGGASSCLLGFKTMGYYDDKTKKVALFDIGDFAEFRNEDFNLDVERVMKSSFEFLE